MMKYFVLLFFVLPAFAAELEEIAAARNAVLAEAALRRAAGLNPGSKIQ